MKYSYLNLLLVGATLLLCSAKVPKVPYEIKQKFLSTAKKFAYQEHIHYEKKQKMCLALVEVFRQLRKIKSEEANLLIQDIYLLGNDYETCNRKKANGLSEFSGWNEVEDDIRKLKKWKRRDFSCKNFKQDDWVALFVLTENDDGSCPAAMKLVEPHYHHDYKMRNWE